MRIIACMGMAALLLAGTAPALAAETNQEQVICNLASKNCLGQAETIQKKVKKVRSDIEKGTRTYSAEDLKKIEQKLKEANDLLDSLKEKAKK